MSGSRVAALRRSFKVSMGRTPQPAVFRVVKRSAPQMIGPFVMSIGRGVSRIIHHLIPALKSVEVRQRNEFRVWKKMYRAEIDARATAPVRVKDSHRHYHGGLGRQGMCSCGHAWISPWDQKAGLKVAA